MYLTIFGFLKITFLMHSSFI